MKDRIVLLNIWALCLVGCMERPTTVELGPDNMGRDAYAKILDLVPEEGDIGLYDLSLERSARLVGRALFESLDEAPIEVRERELAYYATRIGQGTPEQDLYWLLSSVEKLSMWDFHPVDSTQLEISEAQVGHLLRNKVAFDRYAQSVAWFGRVFTPRHHNPLLEPRRNHYGPLILFSLQGPGKFPRDENGDPKPEYWWDARKALVIARLCDSEGDFSAWTPESVDRKFAAWFPKWKEAKELGLLRPGKQFGWRVERSANARRLSVLPPPTIPELPFENCRFRPIGYGVN